MTPCCCRAHEALERASRVPAIRSNHLPLRERVRDRFPRPDDSDRSASRSATRQIATMMITDVPGPRTCAQPTDSGQDRHRSPGRLEDFAPASVLRPPRQRGSLRSRGRLHWRRSGLQAEAYEPEQQQPTDDEGVETRVGGVSFHLPPVVHDSGARRHIHQAV